MTDLRAAVEIAVKTITDLINGKPDCVTNGLEVRDFLCEVLAQGEQSKYSDIVSDGGLDPRNQFDAQPEQELDLGIDRGAWSDVPDATKWVDELRGDDEPEQEPVAWKPVVGYEEFYEVSSIGDLRDAKTKKIKSKSLMGAGYVKADLWANGTRKQTSMHRLVAEAFLIPTGNANEVNHKNGIKTDNRVENLEWVTRSYNVNHSYYELNNQVKPISATHIETGNTLYYPSVEAAVRDGFCSAHISSVIAGRRKHHKGFVFKEAAPPSKPEQGCCECGVTVSENYALYCVKCVEPLFKKEWVSLTDEEINEAANKAGFGHVNIAYEIEAALKERNT